MEQYLHNNDIFFLDIILLLFFINFNLSFFFLFYCMYAIIFILIRACEYMNERRVFDVIYFVPLRRKGANPYDDHNALAMLLGSCMGSAGEYVYGVEDLIRVLLGNTGSLAERSQADRGRSSTNRGQVCVCVNLNFKHTS